MHTLSFESKRLILVTGPARSGKSEWAEWLATQFEASLGKSIVYIATATIDTTDQEWQTRITSHQQRRPSTWQSIEAPIEVAANIRTFTALHHPNQPSLPSPTPDPTYCLLIDSLGTWLANCLEQDDSTWQETVQEFLDSLQTATTPIILVAEETGWGVVPASPIGRQFRDRLGNLTRRVGAIADSVYLVIGGYLLDLTELGIKLPQGSAD